MGVAPSVEAIDEGLYFTVSFQKDADFVCLLETRVELHQSVGTIEGNLVDTQENIAGSESPPRPAPSPWEVA